MKTILRVATPPHVTLDPGSEPIVADGKVKRSASDYAYPVEPPRDWFARREYDSVQPIEVTPEGRVFGHAWDWKQPHIGVFDGTVRKLYAPRNKSGYSRYLNKHVLCDDGTQVKTGVIYIDCPDHADRRMSGQQAQAAMAATGTAVADVVVYEDRFGGQIAGAVRPHATPAQVRVLRGSDLSPDWRKDPPGPGGQYEMFGMISVNTSGLPVPATIAASGEVTVPAGVPSVLWDYESGEPQTLVAVGMVHHAEPDPMDEVRERLARAEAFIGELQADRVMARLRPELHARADAVMARIG